MTLTIHLKPDQPEALPERINEGGGVTKQASSSVYIIPSTYTGEIFGLLIYLTLGKDKDNKSLTFLKLS
jgi:hypothetical protein